MTLDINPFREEKSAKTNLIKQSESNRNKSPQVVEEIIATDEQIRHVLFSINRTRRRLNTINKEIKALYNSSKKNLKFNNNLEQNETDSNFQKLKSDIELLKKEKKTLEDSINPLENSFNSLNLKLKTNLKSVGNILDPLVPIGPESFNKVVNIFVPENYDFPLNLKTFFKPEDISSLNLISKINIKEKEKANETQNKFSFLENSNSILPHHEIMSSIGLHLEQGSLIAGHRGYFLSSDLYLLSSALSSFAFSFLISKGYIPVQPPYMMKKKHILSTCQISDLSENLYSIPSFSSNDENSMKNDSEYSKNKNENIMKNKNNIKSESDEDLCLIATSEQPLSFFSDNLMKSSDLPRRLAGYSTCFRKEAGSSGKDLKGIFRVHQFEKIEQFVYTTKENSCQELKRMVGIAEDFLKELEIPFRTVLVSSEELNDAASVKYDIEGFFPGKENFRKNVNDENIMENKIEENKKILGEFRELMSVSNCTDYQSREIGKKYNDKGEKFFVHMLNGTLCAVQRTLCCYVENWQVIEKQKDGKIKRGVRISEKLKRFWLGEEKDIVYFK